MWKISAIVILLLAAVAVVLAANSYLNLPNQRKEQIMNEENEAISTASVNDLTITVIYDNNPYKEGLQTAWGFSCLVTGAEKTILFDTGGDGSILLGNMEKLAIEPNSIDTVVLSHIHGDHTGGLDSFLKKNPDVTIYVPKSFPKKFKDNILSFRAKIVEVEQPLKICENVYSTGELGRLIKEQSLIIQTDKGLIVITGCAHPGIAKIVNAAKDLLRVPALREPKDDVLLVMGGFHLEWATKGKIEKIISAFKQIGVRYVGPGHCSGHKARTLFEKHFGTNYINVGAGKVITAVDLQ
jgi:7,8-dihydropterin-6-yl-methyl-4-(beta-D-ribofuranosyl)aminobenzene 5'-phosphate synthase